MNKPGMLVQGDLSCSFRLVVALLIAATVSGGAGASEPGKIDAQWIAPPGNPIRDANVAYFRRTVHLDRVPQRLMVNVSADNRFQLHVNGKRAGEGPARGDVRHCRYETFDLAPLLHTGDNTIAALVWNFGQYAPVAQMSARTGFLLYAEDPAQSSINTGPEWQVKRDSGRGVVLSGGSLGYYAAGAPELMDGTKIDWEWDGASSEAAGWEKPAVIGGGALRGAQDSPTPWGLVKDGLPPMEYVEQPAGKIVRVEGIPGTTPSDFRKAITVPAYSDARILVDNGVLTTAYPEVQMSGANATVDVIYSEALYDANHQKGNRNEVAGRQILGLRDHIIADGQQRTYSPLWWRCWRYLELDVHTGNAPLTITGLRSYFSAYPFQAEGKFDSDDPELQRIWEVGWRTARLDAHETYMDTPYWEQLQYVGDTRIQALISYGVAGDDRLARQALMAYRDSLESGGVDPEPISVGADPDHSAVFAAVGRNGARFLDISQRSGFSAQPGSGNSRGAGLVPGAAAPGWAAGIH